MSEGKVRYHYDMIMDDAPDYLDVDTIEFLKDQAKNIQDKMQYIKLLRDQHREQVTKLLRGKRTSKEVRELVDILDMTSDTIVEKG